MPGPLMREANLLRGCMRGRRRRGTTPRRSKVAQPAEDLVKRNFAATEVDKVWVADITYVATAEGFLYLAFVLDVHCREGSSGGRWRTILRTELVVDALRGWPCGGASPHRGWSTIRIVRIRVSVFGRLDPHSDGPLVPFPGTVSRP
ncbi:MAG: hypothetical protein H0T57_05630 [Rubrobacter sp.]|nr:hypothetical protein [Rubrobacter sp.]